MAILASFKRLKGMETALSNEVTYILRKNESAWFGFMPYTIEIISEVYLNGFEISLGMMAESGTSIKVLERFHSFNKALDAFEEKKQLAKLEGALLSEYDKIDLKH